MKYYRIYVKLQDTYEKQLIASAGDEDDALKLLNAPGLVELILQESGLDVTDANFTLCKIEELIEAPSEVDLDVNGMGGLQKILDMTDELS